MFVRESSPQAHSASGVERAKLEAAHVLVDIATEDDSGCTFDNDNAAIAVSGNGFQLDGQSGGFVVNEDLLILDLDLIGSVGEDDGFFDTVARRLFELNGDGKVHVEEIASQHVLAASTAQVVGFLVKGDDTLGTDQRSMSYIPIEKSMK